MSTPELNVYFKGFTLLEICPVTSIFALVAVTETSLGLDIKNSHTILLVEDNEDDVLLLTHALKRAGVTRQLTVVSDGEQAFSYLKGDGEYAERSRFPIPQIIVLDLQMPRMTGFEFLEWLRREPGLPLPVVVLTISAHPADLERAYQLGANSVLPKSVSLEKFSATVKQMVDFWLDASQLPTLPWTQPTSQKPVVPPPPDNPSG